MTDDLKNIIHAAQRGDEAAFRQLIERHYAYVHRIAYRVLLSEDEAKDAAQDAFIKVWKHIGTYNSAMNFTTWLYRIVSNTAIDARRGNVRRAPERSEDISELASDESLEHKVDSQDLTNIIHSMLGHLPPLQRLIFALRDCEDLSVADVATVTGMSNASVRTNLSYARKRLRELLASKYDIGGILQ